MRTAGLLVSVMLAATPASVWGLPVDEVVRKTGVRGGFCSFPCATAADEPLVFELAARPTFVVHAMSDNAKVIEQFRARAEAAGLLGRSLYVEQGKESPLPFADRLVDLLVVTGLKDADVTSERRAAWTRVLVPRRGAALVGQAVWRNDLPAGSDPWTHRYHGADNAKTSSDSTLKPPFLAQWWGFPRFDGWWGSTTVAGNGRLFSLRASRDTKDTMSITARSLGSGIALWQRQFRRVPPAYGVAHGGYIPGSMGLVLDGDALFLTDGPAVKVIDAETGTEKPSLAGPRPEGQIKWMAHADGLLAVLAGETDVKAAVVYQVIAANPLGRDLAVYETGSGRTLWRDTVAGDIDQRALAIRDGRLFALVQGVGLVCRELRTGKTVWTNPDPQIQADFLTPAYVPSGTPVYKAVGGLLFAQPVLSVFADVVLLRSQWAGSTVAFANSDGTPLWRKPTISSIRAVQAVGVDGLWIGAGPKPLDLKTGSEVDGPKFIRDGCGPTTAMPGHLVSAHGGVLDMKSGKVIRPGDVKTVCEIGAIVAEGMLINAQEECVCGSLLRGYRVLASAGSIQPHTAPPWKERLTVLDTVEPPALVPAEADWPTYRHDPRRSAASAASVGESPGILWRWKPAGAAPYTNELSLSGHRMAPDFMTTAAVAAGGLAWFASPDGMVRCVTASDGQELWRFQTAGKVFAPPTVWQGRVLVGGGDGRIYCLNATTGRCLWQFRAAPLERRVFWWGHLVSTWPVITGVVVHDNVAYAVAGYQKDNGVHAYAIDPGTGNVLWEKDDAGLPEPGRLWYGMDSFGNVAVDAGRLWLAAPQHGSFDLKSGTWKCNPGASAGGREAMGSEVAVFGGRWVVQGGSRLSETQGDIARQENAGFSAYPVEKFAASYGPATWVGGGIALPAWDAELCVLLAGRYVEPRPSASLSGVPMARMEAWFEKRFAQPKATAADSQAKPQEWSELSAWSITNLASLAFVLAKDQLVVAHGTGKTGYKISGFKRSDGSQTWSVDLPEPPAANRLAIDRDGRILLTLCDGSVLCIGRKEQT